MAKPTTDYIVKVRIKGEDRHPTATALARLIREQIKNLGYDVTVSSQKVVPEVVEPSS